jgi:hypothetical protein
VTPPIEFSTLPTTFIGLANPLTPPKMEMYDQKNKMSF